MKTAVVAALLIASAPLYAATNENWGGEDNESSTVIGGYGELHLNLTRTMTSTNGVFDFHRFVLFVAHRFNSEWSFASELELEHQFVKDNHGELELEQAYVQYRPSDLFSLRAGTVLVPVGQINGKHEPETFLGVERPKYYNTLVPTTWYANGVQILGEAAGFEWAAGAVNGLDGTQITASKGIRDSRRNAYSGVFTHNGENLLYSALVDFTGIKGLKAGVSGHYNSAWTSASNSIPLLLTEGHIRWDGAGILFAADFGWLGYFATNAADLSSSAGISADLGCDVAAYLSWPVRLIPFARGYWIDTAFTRFSGAASVSWAWGWAAGLNFEPVPGIVFKADVGEEYGTNAYTVSFNAGAGYHF